MEFYIKTDIKKVPFIFKNKKDESEYVRICEKLWGGIPCEVMWAMGTNVYKSELTAESK